MTGKLTPGQIVVYRDLDSYGIAKVDIVRERDVTVFPWAHANRAWAKRRQRIARDRVIGTIPRAREIEATAERLKVLANMRDAARRQAVDEFHRKAEQLVQREHA